jgi:CheY-like chemotaxis protein
MTPEPSYDRSPALENARGTILLAEDDGDLRAALAELLKRDGYKVVEIGHGAFLLDYLTMCWLRPDTMLVPDIILSDIRMPGFSGLEILAALKRTQVTIPVVLITAFPTTVLSERAHALGAATVLSKPFDVDDLRMIVLNLMCRLSPETHN